MDSILLFSLPIFLLSGFAHGLLGFGFPMVATPLLSVFLSVKEAVLLTLFPTLVANTRVIKKGGNFFDIWKEYKLLITFVVFGSFLGTNFLINYDTPYYKLLLAFVILLYLNRDYMKISLEKIFLKNPIIMMILFGFLSGIVSGLVNIMIPILVIYIIESKISKEKSFVLMNFCFFSSKLTQIIIFGTNGNFSLDFSYMMIPIIFISILGLILGEKIRKYIDEKLYKKILIWLLWLLSIYLILDTFLYQ
ncbi:MAG TPA: sulfite exporter TauE/SafE family protein [Sulfurospirillum arcachonense]|nr:sulfite exporter TauE/SafE family protein [Sulfurospirillum arcachonense]